MKLDNNLFIPNGVIITQHNNYLNASIPYSWSTPGIKYNKNIRIILQKYVNIMFHYQITPKINIIIMLVI